MSFIRTCLPRHRPHEDPARGLDVLSSGEGRATEMNILVQSFIHADIYNTCWWTVSIEVSTGKHEADKHAVREAIIIVEGSKLFDASLLPCGTPDRRPC